MCVTAQAEQVPVRVFSFCDSYVLNCSCKCWFVCIIMFKKSIRGEKSCAPYFTFTPLLPDQLDQRGLTKTFNSTNRPLQVYFRAKGTKVTKQEVLFLDCCVIGSTWVRREIAGAWTSSQVNSAGTGELKWTTIELSSRVRWLLKLSVALFR